MERVTCGSLVLGGVVVVASIVIDGRGDDNRGIFGDSGPFELFKPLGLFGLFDLSSDVVEIVTPTRPLSLMTSAFRLVPVVSLSLSFFFSTLDVSILGVFGSAWMLLERSALKADAIFGPAAVAAARQLGGEDSDLSNSGFFSGSLVSLTGSLSFSASSSLWARLALLLPLLLLLLLLELERVSPSSDSSSDEVLNRRSRCDTLPPAVVCCWSAFLFGPRLLVAASLSRLWKEIFNLIIHSW